jgi:hypothetical protein
MSRKRKKMNDSDEANETMSGSWQAEVEPSSKSQSDAPVFEPLIPSFELLNQINNALTASTLAQSPLMEGM